MGNFILFVPRHSYFLSPNPSCPWSEIEISLPALEGASIFLVNVGSRSESEFDDGHTSLFPFIFIYFINFKVYL